jgi:hypothetical protein
MLQVANCIMNILLGNTTSLAKYKITLRLFRDCYSTGPSLQSEAVNVGIYENGSLANTLNLPMVGGIETIILNTSAFPCLVGNVNVCYELAYYSATIELPINNAGYVLARTGCCRVDNIENTVGSNNNIGATYTTKIQEMQLCLENLIIVRNFILRIPHWFVQAKIFL